MVQCLLFISFTFYTAFYRSTYLTRVFNKLKGVFKKTKFILNRKDCLLETMNLEVGVLIKLGHFTFGILGLDGWKMY